MYREDVGWTSTTLVIQNPVELRNAFRKDLLEFHCQIMPVTFNLPIIHPIQSTHLATFIFHPSNRSMNLSSSFKGLHKIFANLHFLRRKFKLLRNSKSWKMALGVVNSNCFFDLDVPRQGQKQPMNCSTCQSAVQVAAKSMGEGKQPATTAGF